MRDLRRRHQCSKDGCDSQAVYEVYLHFRYGRRHVAQERLKSSLRVCEAHKRAANDYILSEANKAIISGEMAKQGRLSIDWPNAMIEYVPVGESSWLPDEMVAIQAGVA